MVPHVTVISAAPDGLSAKLAASKLLQHSRPSESSLRNVHHKLWSVLNCIWQVWFLSPVKVTYEFKCAAGRKTRVASRDSNQRNPTTLMQTNTSVTLKNTGKRWIEYSSYRQPHFPYTVGSLVTKMPKMSTELPRFCLTKLQTSVFTFIYSLVKWGVGLDSL